MLHWYTRYGNANRREPLWDPGNPFVAAYRGQSECNRFVKSRSRDLGGMADAFQIGYGDAARLDCHKGLAVYHIRFLFAILVRQNEKNMLTNLHVITHNITNRWLTTGELIHWGSPVVSSFAPATPFLSIRPSRPGCRRPHGTPPYRPERLSVNTIGAV